MEAIEAHLNKHGIEMVEFIAEINNMSEQTQGGPSKYTEESWLAFEAAVKTLNDLLGLPTPPDAVTLMEAIGNLRSTFEGLSLESSNTTDDTGGNTGADPNSNDGFGAMEIAMVIGGVIVLIGVAISAAIIVMGARRKKVR
jgi:hypothetical protein